MIFTQRFFLMIVSLFLAGTLASCEKEGPAERAGERIDESVEKMGEKIEDAGDKAQETTNR